MGWCLLGRGMTHQAAGVVELGPLAVCTVLRIISCRDTRVVGVGPLLACRSLDGEVAVPTTCAPCTGPAAAGGLP